MIKHVVMFKLKEFETQAEKEAKMEEIRRRLEFLIHKIDVLRSIRVCFNCNPEEKWDIILIAELISLDDINAYATHPEHVVVAKEIIAPVIVDRACVDYDANSIWR